MANFKAYDEAYDIPDQEDIPSPRTASELNFKGHSSNIFQSNKIMSDIDSKVYVSTEKLKRKEDLKREEPDLTESSGDDDDEEEDDEESVPLVAGAYNPSDFDHLVVSQEIKELFQYIQRYTPQTIELETRLLPFIPEYIPSVGDIDAFIKIPRPDLKPDDLGLRLLDEPCAKQSDPFVLDLQLRALSKQSRVTEVVVSSIEVAEKNPKKIDKWIKSITDLHRSKPPQSVHYSKNMPDVETLMQAWSPEMEQLFKTINLPTADLDCSLTCYVDLICGVLDIPVYTNRIQSLHLLFTVYNEFKNSQHFQ